MAEHNDGIIADRLIAILADLIAIPTAYPPGHSVEMGRHLCEFLRGHGYEVYSIACADGMDNVVARMGSGSPSLVLNTHIDTVGPGDLGLWTNPPFEATVDSGFIYGLGAANCKGSGATQLWLAEQVARAGGPSKGEIVFTFVTDEESLGPNGMAHLREIGAVKPDILLLGAPTDNTLITSERGVLWVEINTFGKPAHAGEPEAGDNAISRMIRICRAVEDQMAPRLAERVDGDMRSTMNLGWFHGGENTNVVPSRCQVQIDRRLLPSETVDGAFAELRDIVVGVGEPEDLVTIENLRGTNGFLGAPDGTMVSALSAAITARTGNPAAFTSAIGVSDGRYFADDGIEIVNFGPGIGSEGHAANESVEISKLVDSAIILLEACDSIVGFTN